MNFLRALILGVLSRFVIAYNNSGNIYGIKYVRFWNVSSTVDVPKTQMLLGARLDLHLI